MGPAFWIIQIGAAVRWTWGIVHARGYIPDLFRFNKKFFKAVKTGFDVGYTYDRQTTLPLKDNPLLKLSQIFFATNYPLRAPLKSWRSFQDKAKNKKDGFKFFEPLIQVGITFKGNVIFFPPLFRLGYSRPRTTDQIFTVAQPLRVVAGGNLQFHGVSAGYLKHIYPNPRAKGISSFGNLEAYKSVSAPAATPKPSEEAQEAEEAEKAEAEKKPGAEEV